MNTTERALRRRAAWISGRAARVSALASVVALVGVSAAVAARTTTIRSTNNATFGRILEGPSKFTLYVFVHGVDSKGSAHSSPKFPPIIASGRVVAARGSHIKASKLRTRKLKNGKKQVTYYGQPLYLYKGDRKPGQTKGEEKFSGGGAYFVVSTSGRPLQSPGYCLSVTDRIATPQGSLPVAQVRPGMHVWSTDRQGRRISVKVLRVHHTAVPSNHMMVRLRLADGRTVLVSLGHPLPSGAAIRTLAAGQRFEGTKVVSAARVRYGKPYTYDLLPAGPTHTYYADGVLLGSTLAPAGTYMPRPF